MNNIHKDNIEQQELNIAMNNAYDILMGDVTLDDLLTTKEGSVYLAFDPEDIQSDKGWSDTINQLIDYFVELEEYEKCAELKSIL
jgi:hypothetical protein